MDGKKLQLSLPAALLRSLQNIPGFNEEAFKKVHSSGDQVVSIRLNPSKNKKRLTGNVQQETAIPWCSNGYYLTERPSFTLDPLFHAGAYYVQEASSMFLEQVIRQSVDLAKPLKVLDLCAAPGGKSTLIQSLVSGESLLVSNEVIKTRVNVLAENITKWGAANVIVTNNDPKDFQRLQNYFDVIIVDAPCSGSGLFRKDPAALNEWSEQNVQLCSQRQQRILADILPSLKEEGILIYSTCSYSEDEDETICDWLLSVIQHPVSGIRLQLQPEWAIVETLSRQHKAYGYRFYPDKLKGEGFFIAAFKKERTTEDNQPDRKQKSRSEKLPANEIEVLKPYLSNAADFFFIKQDTSVIAFPSKLEDEFATIRSSLYIKKAGVMLGTIIRNELIPDHELAMSTLVDGRVPRIEVDVAIALQYLRKQEFRIHSDLKGWVLITCAALPLGWVKILPGRVNNYYPKDWRILNK